MRAHRRLTIMLLAIMGITLTTIIGRSSDRNAPAGSATSFGVVWAAPEQSAPAAPAQQGTGAATMSLQGSLFDSSGNPITGAREIRFRLYNDGAADASIYEETIPEVQVRGGLFQVVLGSTPAKTLPGVTAEKPIFVGIQVKGESEMVPRLRIHPVPWAMTLVPGATISGTMNAPLLGVINPGLGQAIWAKSKGEAIRGIAEGANGGSGVHGESNTGAGVFGSGIAGGPGVRGESNKEDGVIGVAFANGKSGVYGGGSQGVWGVGTSKGVHGESEGGIGVEGINNNGNWPAVYGYNRGGNTGVKGESEGNASGVVGTAKGHGQGVYGESLMGGAGVYGKAQSTGIGVYGESNFGFGVQGRVNTLSGKAGGHFSSAGGPGLITEAGACGANCAGIEAHAGSSSYAGKFWGTVDVYGKIYKDGGSFRIDHPLDPANRYLSHSFVESPDMMNIYNGNITTDAVGTAVVVLPDYFEALNRDFRYQLTVIGDFAQAIVATEVKNGRFTIRTDKPNVKVSWQVTGIRHDAWADANPIVVEETKVGTEAGRYRHPELFGKPKSLGVFYDPELDNGSVNPTSD